MSILSANALRWFVASGLVVLAAALGLVYESRPGEVWEVRAMVGLLLVLALWSTPLDQWIAMHLPSAGHRPRPRSTAP